MARKQTSAKVSKIAGKYLGDKSPLTPDIEVAIANAIQVCGLPLNDRAILALTNKIEAALAPIIDDLRTLAASCLSQDETPSEPADNAD